MDKSMIFTFEELIKKYRPTVYNGTTPVASVLLNGERALLSVETASMASKVIIHEAFKEDILIRTNIVNSLEKSLRDNSKVWDELSKH